MSSRFDSQPDKTNTQPQIAEELVTALVVSEDPFNDSHNPHASTGHSYSLLLLFYLTTLCAILAATCRLAVSGSLWTASAFIQGWFGFGLLGVFFATVATFLTGPNAKSITMGLLAAVIMACLASFISLIEPAHFQNLSLIIPAGCLLLVFIALVSSKQ